MAQLKRTKGFTKSPDLAGHEKGVLNPFNKGDAASYNWYRTFKNPKELSDQLLKETDYYNERATSPLEEFKLFEQANIYPSDEHNLRPRFGISERSIPYGEYLNAYAKSKGKYAGQANDPEIQKYFNDQLAYRNGIFDRVRKIPADKFQDFAHGYGFYADPFDYEDEGYEPPKDTEEFLSWFDSYPIDWDTLEGYLTDNGY